MNGGENLPASETSPISADAEAPMSPRVPLSEDPQGIAGKPAEERRRRSQLFQASPPTFDLLVCLLLDAGLSLPLTFRQPALGHWAPRSGTRAPHGRTFLP